MSNGEKQQQCITPPSGGGPDTTPTPPAPEPEAVCPAPSPEPDTSKIPQQDLDVVVAQRELDRNAAQLASKRTKIAAMNNRVAADAAWEQEKRKHAAAMEEAGYARTAARNAADLKLTTDLRDAPKTDCAVPSDVRRLLEEQRCEAYHRAEVAYYTAIQKAELDLKQAEATWNAAKLAQTHAETLADKNEALDRTRAEIKYYQALGKLLKK